MVQCNTIPNPDLNLEEHYFQVRLFWDLYILYMDQLILSLCKFHKSWGEGVKQENISADVQEATWIESWAILANFKKQLLHFQHIVFL